MEKIYSIFFSQCIQTILAILQAIDKSTKNGDETDLLRLIGIIRVITCSFGMRDTGNDNIAQIKVTVVSDDALEASGCIGYSKEDFEFQLNTIHYSEKNAAFFARQMVKSLKVDSSSIMKLLRT